MKNAPSFVPCCIMLALCLALTGCAELEMLVDEFNTSIKSGESELKSGGGSPLSSASSSYPVRVILDGKRDVSEKEGVYWNTHKPVSSTPEMVFKVDLSLGEFQSCIINLFNTEPGGMPRGKAWAIIDSDSDTKTLVPNQAFTLTSPGPDVKIISPAGEMTDSIVLESGKVYVAMLVITGSNKSHTHHVRFQVK